MSAKILEHNDTYYCSNCRMKQFELEPTCKFCGEWFYNYESIIIEGSAAAFKENVEAKRNESNIYGRD